MIRHRRRLGSAVLAGVTVLSMAVFAGLVAARTALQPVAATSSPDEDPRLRERTPETPHAASAFHRQPPPIPPELVERCMEVAREVDPEFADRLEALHRAAGPEFDRSIRRARHLVGLARLKERDPQLYDVKVRELRGDAHINRVMDQIVEARRTGSDTEALEAALFELVREQVSLAIANRGMYLNALEEHVEALRQRLDREGDNFNVTVNERYRELLRQIDEADAAGDEPATG